MGIIVLMRLFLKVKYVFLLISNIYYVSVYSCFFDIFGYICDVSIFVFKVGIKIYLILYG